MIKKSSGFTLIELLVAMAIFSIIITLIISSKLRQTDQGVTQQQAVDMQQTARSVVSLMSSQLRQAGYNPHYKDYGPGITVATATSLTFTYVASDDGSDNNGDGDTDEDGEFAYVTYEIQDPDGDGDNDITVDYNPSPTTPPPYPQTLAENVSNLTFTYFDGDGAGLTVPVSNTDLDEIRSVGINITVQIDAGELARSTTNNTRSMTTRVYLRNLGF